MTAPPRPHPALHHGTLHDLMTPAEAADFLGISARRVTAIARRGLVSFIRTPGGHRRYPRSAVDALAAANARKLRDGHRWIAAPPPDAAPAPAPDAAPPPDAAMRRRLAAAAAHLAEAAQHLAALSEAGR